ncbi:patatin-like phospholipase family protein [bacterium]|nr:patatin-like phospholipase family protein [bacterium]
MATHPSNAGPKAGAPAGERAVLVLQGGGALGAYQAGTFEELARAGNDMAWVAGISIGAINAALICGNPPEHRVSRLRAFWEGITANLTLQPVFALPGLDLPGVDLPAFEVPGARSLFSEMASNMALAFGAPGFFAPRFPWAGLTPTGALRGTSFYDTAPLRETLLELVDFDYLNTRGPRLSVGTVDVETGNFVYFDSATTRIAPEHIMASGALPPGFPAVEIDGRQYWDGGLVSNTPLQYVLENAGTGPLLVFQVDLFAARGPLPETLAEVSQREKDIRFSSRTRLTTDRFRQLHALRAAAERLAAKLPAEMADDPDLALLRKAGPSCPVTLVHLIHRNEDFEGAAKDYEFSRLTMEEHWKAGRRDVGRTFDHRAWRQRAVEADGLRVFDLSARPNDA